MPEVAPPAAPATAAPLPSPPAPAGAAQAFGRDLMAALARRPRRISPKYFYDEAGSQLFERICELPEYYPTRTELALLRRHAAEMAACMGEEVELVEFGAGAGVKVRPLLDALARPRRYLPLDISVAHLQASAGRLAAHYPGLAVTPVAADFTRAMDWPDGPGGAGARRAGFFPGSSIGNFSHAQAVAFLRRAAVLLRGGGLLLGVDLVKDPALLQAAYNDAQGVTAAFNRNLLVRANRELGADFVPERFAHHAFYDPRRRCVEMHLVSLCRQAVRVGGRRFGFGVGDSLHTEDSRKFTHEDVHRLASQSGFALGPAWTDPQGLFSLHWLAAPPY